ncbi:unnamed protein product [Chondrus crispus]|uniref:Uncharacterized protein n=1 Tax=Chondrus crispus TaxID=2769 RepID=R7QCU8_CHOCR|nr:unnamed protein product [Chondrus crispus]CDF36332.1 unnamed protein product [Chondrus crispus]|eukprot:XP_005716151.1 unnamed protein product [Chondrus crispus]
MCCKYTITFRFTIIRAYLVTDQTFRSLCRLWSNTASLPTFISLNHKSYLTPGHQRQPAINQFPDLRHHSVLTRHQMKAGFRQRERTQTGNASLLHNFPSQLLPDP